MRKPGIAGLSFSFVRPFGRLHCLSLCHPQSAGSLLILRALLTGGAATLVLLMTMLASLFASFGRTLGIVGEISGTASFVVCHCFLSILTPLD
jgi:hypothetical protein